MCVWDHWPVGTTNCVQVSTNLENLELVLLHHLCNVVVPLAAKQPRRMMLPQTYSTVLLGLKALSLCLQTYHKKHVLPQNVSPELIWCALGKEQFKEVLKSIILSWHSFPRWVDVSFWPQLYNSFCLIFHIFIAKNLIIGLHVPKRVCTDLNFLFKKLKIFYFKVTNNDFRGVSKGLWNTSTTVGGFVNQQ